MLDDVNLGNCHEEVFTFISKCKNTKKLLLYDITDDSGDDSDIVQGITSVLPKLGKLRDLDILDIYVGERGKSLMDKMKNTELRLWRLCNTHLSNSGPSFVSCLSSLPLLSFVSLFNSGLSQTEMKQVLLCLPSSCPKLLCLNMSSYTFSDVELKPVYLLHSLRSIAFCPVSDVDMIESLKNLPETLTILYLAGSVTISNRLHEFISAIKSLPKLSFLVVDDGCLNSEGEERVSEVLKQTGGRFVNSDTDPEGWMDHRSQLTILAGECFNVT